MRPKLSDKQKLAIYNQHCFGEKIEDLAESYGCSNATIYRCIREMRERHESGKDDEMAARSKVVAGDKANGRLLSTTDPHRFEGTCVVGGKKQSKAFVTVNAKKATEMWEKWCQDLRDEQEFMDRVERKPKEESFVPTDEPMAFEDFLEDEPKAVCGAPSDPIEEIHPIQVIEPAPVPEINVRPWKEVAEERQAEIDELKRRIEYLEGRLEGYESTTQLTTSGPSYVLWAKTDVPKLYGLYGTMEAALAEVDRLNEVAAFLGGGSVFEVEEVTWKG